MDNKVVTTRSAPPGTQAPPPCASSVASAKARAPGGIGEVEDLIAAPLAQQKVPGRPVAGGFVRQLWRRAAPRCAPTARAAALFLVAPPVHHYGFETIEKVGCPVTVCRARTTRWCPRTRCSAGGEYRADPGSDPFPGQRPFLRPAGQPQGGLMLPWPTRPGPSCHPCPGTPLTRRSSSSIMTPLEKYEPIWPALSAHRPRKRRPRARSSVPPPA